MKKKSILFVLAVILIALLASCNDEGGLFEDASNRAESSDLTILSILGANGSDVYFLSLEKGVHVLHTSETVSMETVIDKTASDTPNFFDAGMSGSNIYVRQYEDTTKGISGGQIAEYGLNGTLTTQTNLVFTKLAPNGYGLKTGAVDSDGNFYVYQGTESTDKAAKNIIYANGENVIFLIKKTSPTDVFYVNNKEFTSDILLVSCVGNSILAGNKTIRSAEDNSVVTTITDTSFTIPSNPIGFSIGGNSYFRGTKSFVDASTGQVVNEPWTKPFDSSVEITGAVTVGDCVYLSTKSNGIWRVDSTESKRVF